MFRNGNSHIEMGPRNLFQLGMRWWAEPILCLHHKDGGEGRKKEGMRSFLIPPMQPDGIPSSALGSHTKHDATGSRSLPPCPHWEKQFPLRPSQAWSHMAAEEGGWTTWFPLPSSLPPLGKRIHSAATILCSDSGMCVNQEDPSHFLPALAGKGNPLCSSHARPDLTCPPGRGVNH